MSTAFNVRCERCGEYGTEKRMNLINGECFYCREEREPTVQQPSEIYRLRARNAEMLEALERIAEICDTRTSALHPLRDIARAAIEKEGK